MKHKNKRKQTSWMVVDAVGNKRVIMFNQLSNDDVLAAYEFARDKRQHIKESFWRFITSELVYRDKHNIDIKASNSPAYKGLVCY